MRVYLTALLLIAAYTWTTAQTARLLVDQVPGMDSHADDRLSFYDGTLTYPGFDEDGNKGLYQYDRDGDEIALLLAESDVEGDMIGLANYNGVLLVFTGEDDVRMRVYESTQRDLSDIELVYDASDADISAVQSTNDYLSIQQESIDSMGNAYQSIIVLDGDRQVVYESERLYGSRFRYFTFPMDRYFVILDFSAKGLDEAMTLVDTETNSPLLFRDIVVEPVDCSEIIFVRPAVNRYVFITCTDGYSLIDLVTGEEVVLPSDFIALRNISEAYMVYTNTQGNISLLDRSTMQPSRLFSDGFTSSVSSIDYTVLYQVAGTSTIDYVLIDMADRSVIDSKVQTSLDFTAVDINSVVKTLSGWHMMVSDRTSNEAAVIRCEETSSPELTQFTKPTSGYVDLVPLEEDIYYINADSDVGAEIFVIDYSTSSSAEHEVPNSWRLMPNPVADNTVTLDGLADDAAVAHITNLTGQIISKKQIHDSSPTVDVSDLPAGTFIVTILTAEGKWVGSQKLLRH